MCSDGLRHLEELYLLTKDLIGGTIVNVAGVKDRDCVGVHVGSAIEELRAMECCFKLTNGPLYCNKQALLRD